MSGIERLGNERFPVKQADRPTSKVGHHRADGAVFEAELIRACAIANRSPAIRALERDWDALTDEALEPWDESTQGELQWIRADRP